MLVNCDSSGEEDGEIKMQTDRSAALDYSHFSKVLSELKGKYSLDSAPGVPKKETGADLLRIDPSTKTMDYNTTLTRCLLPR